MTFRAALPLSPLAIACGGAVLWGCSALLATPAQAACVQTGSEVECTGFDDTGFLSSQSLTVLIRPDAFVRNIISVERVGLCPLSLPGIEVGDSSRIVNDGLVSTFGVCGFGLVTGNSSSVVNNGTILAHDIVAYGIITGDDSTVRNRGILTTFMQGSSGILAGARAQIVAESGGRITTGGAASIGIEAGANASITNAGSIVTTGDAAHGIDVGAASVVVNGGIIETSANNAFGVRMAGGHLTNSGRIRSVLAGPAFSLVPATGVSIVGRDAIFTNAAGGVVEASHAGVRISATQEASVVNDGRIEAWAAIRPEGAAAADGGAVILAGTAAVSLSNSGTIINNGGAPAIRSLGPQVLFTNRGTIVGDVVLSARDDTIALHEGSSITGTLDAGGGVDTLTFQGAGTLASAITSVEFLSKGGRGDLLLTRNVTATQQVNVFGGGGLILNPGVRLTAATTGNLGSVRGMGVIDGGLENSGLLAPGTAANKGTLTVTGAFRQLAGGTLAIRISPDGTSDRLVIGGPASFAGTLALNYDMAANGPAFQDEQRFDVVTPTSSQLVSTGQFTLDTPGLAFVTPSLVTTPSGGLAVEMDRRSYSTVAVTENQAAAGRMLDRLSASHTGALSPVFAQLEFATAEDATAILAAFAPEAPGGVQNANLMALGRFTEGLRRRAPSSMTAGSFAWARGFTSSGQSRDAAARGDYDLHGLMAGVETVLDDARLGVAAARTGGDFANGGSSAVLDASLFALTAHYAWEHVGFDAALVYGTGSPDLQRTRTLNGASETLAASADADAWSLSFDATLATSLGAARVTPHAGFAYNRLTLNIDERRPLGVRIDNATTDSLRARVGAEISATVGRLRPYGDLSTSAEMLERRPRLTATVIGVPDSSFVLTGDARRRIAVEAEAGLGIALSEGIEAYVAGAIVANDLLAGRTLSAGLTFHW